MTEACTPVTSTTSTAISTRWSGFNWTSQNRVSPIRPSSASAPRSHVSWPVCFWARITKAGKNSATGTDRRQCTWCCSAAPSSCHASTGVRCGRTGVMRRTTSRCGRFTLAVILDGLRKGGMELTPVFTSVMASRWFTGTDRPPESATTEPTGWSTSTPPGSSAATGHSSSRGRWTSAAEPLWTEISPLP